MFYNMDSSYTLNPDSIKTVTIQKENRIAEQIKLLRLAGEKRKRRGRSEGES